MPWLFPLPSTKAGSGQGLDDEGGLRATLEFYGAKAFGYTRPDACGAVVGEPLEKKDPVARRKDPDLQPAEEHDLFDIVWPCIEKEHGNHANPRCKRIARRTSS